MKFTRFEHRKCGLDYF